MDKNRSGDSTKYRASQPLFSLPRSRKTGLLRRNRLSVVLRSRRTGLLWRNQSRRTGLLSRNLPVLRQVPSRKTGLEGPAGGTDRSSGRFLRTGRFLRGRPEKRRNCCCSRNKGVRRRLRRRAAILFLWREGEGKGSASGSFPYRRNAYKVPLWGTL